MTPDEIKQELIQLSKDRRKGVDDSLMAHLRSLTPDAPRRLTYTELMARERELEDKLVGWLLIWDSTNRSYGIIPQE